MKDLLFELSFEDMVLNLVHSPIGWDDVLIKYERSTTYWGVVRSFSIPMKFVKEGAQFLRNAFYNSGTEAGVTISIKKMNKITLQYQLVFTSEIDFTTFIDQDDYVEATLIDNSLGKYFKAKEDETFDLYLNEFDDRNIYRIFFNGDGYVKLGMPSVTIYSALRLMLNKITDGGITSGRFGFRSDFFESQLQDLEHVMVITSSGATASSAQFVNSSSAPLISISFKALFDSISVIFCLGLTIQIIDDKETIVIEPLSNLFSSQKLINLGTANEISLSVNKDMLYGSITCGYETQEYDTVPKDWECNCLSKFGLDTYRSSRTLELISKIRADFSGLVDLWQTLGEGSLDEVYILEIEFKEWAGIGQNWQPQRGDVKYGNNMRNHYNTSLTPARILIRNMDFIESNVFAPGKGYFFKSGGNRNYANSTKADQTEIFINENTSGILRAGNLFYPVVANLETGLLIDLNMVIPNATNQQIGFSYRGTTLWGYLMDVQVKLADRGKQTFKLLLSADNDLNNLIL